MTRTKRLSNRWMGRVAFSWNAFKQHYDDGVIPVNGGDGTQGVNRRPRARPLTRATRRRPTSTR